MTVYFLFFAYLAPVSRAGGRGSGERHSLSRARQPAETLELYSACCPRAPVRLRRAARRGGGRGGRGPGARIFNDTELRERRYGRKAKFNDQITPVRVDCVWISDYL